MRSAWNLDAYFTPAYRNLFINPLYCFAYGLESLAERETPLRVDKQSRSISVDEGVQFRRRDRTTWDQEREELRMKTDMKPIILTPNASIAAYRFWDECYLRWSAPAQTLRGGRVQADLQVSAVLADISHQLNELRYLRDQHEMERAKFGQQLRHYRVQPVSLTPDGMDRITSAFPFGWDTIPIPDYLYILPLRSDRTLQQQGLSTPRSALELATFSMTPQAATLSCDRLSVWGTGGELASFQAAMERSPGAADNDRRPGAISRRKNQSVVERRAVAEPVLSELKNKFQQKPPLNADAFEAQGVRSNRKFSHDTIV